MEPPNQFTTKWGKWLNMHSRGQNLLFPMTFRFNQGWGTMVFKMHSLISKHPNLVPAGNGNGNLSIDTNTLPSGDVMMDTDDPDTMALPQGQ